MMIRRRSTIALGLAALLASASPAHAFTTRIHIVIANKVREALFDAGDGTIQLRLGDHAVVLSADDVAAITDHPLSFRAGAVGPDNMVFPGMTDPSHAIGQRPFEQCELLYQAAVVADERAYALGCFLHGSTDAVAHHYVNYMTGETFTLTPITSARQQSNDNVVRHILAESAIQRAALALDPEAFAGSKLLHTIPVGFVLRTYLDQDSPLWQMMAAHAQGEYDKAVAANPGASLPAIVAAMEVGPADHLVMSPVYLAAVDDLIEAKRLELEAAIAVMQDWNTPEGAQLQVTPGDDGELGTKDDDTDCSLSCPDLFAKYFTYTGLLAPRYNGQQEELPSAFVKITDELRAELLSFHAAYLETVQNLSAKLNEAPNDMSGEFGVTKADLSALFAPLNAWSDKITTIDYDTLVYAVIPDWIIELDTLMQSVGLDIDLAALLKAVFEPIVKPIKDAIQQAFIAQAEVFLGALIEEIEAKKDVVYAEYDLRLAAAAHPNLSGDVLDHFFDSGLYAHAFNIAAAALASHAAVLPVGDEVGPASFDASHTPAWMQAGACDYLREAIFPLGVDARATMSVRDALGDFPAQLTDDSPIECHDGSLAGFAGAPSVVTCAVVKLAALLEDPVGSVSRAYPPHLSDAPASCEGTLVPGLPEPPEGGTTGEAETTGEADTDALPTTGAEPTGGLAPTTGGSAGGSGSSASAGGSGGASEDGCGCQARRPDAGSLGLLGLALLALRRRRRTGGALALAATLGLSACGDDGGDSGGATTTTPTASTTTTGDATTSEPTTTTTEATDSTDPTDPTGTSTTTTSTTTETSGTTGGGSQAGVLLEALGASVWHGEQTRAGETRGYELRFDADSLLWAEVRNPFGPSRLREMRAFMVEKDGESVHSTVIQPPGWEVHPDNGRQDDWTLEVIEGDPRILRAARDGAVEEFVEGPWPVPEDGLTATVHVFKVGGPVDMAFCDSGLNGFDYPELLAFARGDSPDIVATDVVAGAYLRTWTDLSNNNQFSVNDVDGFDRLGGTELSDTFNFFVTYTGTISHPGGPLSMRELDDSVEDAVWTFLGDKAGSGGEADLFLEVQGFAWPDGTSDEPSGDFPAGDLPIEAIVVRCTEAIKNVDVQLRVGAGPWTLVGDAASTPVITSELFPPVF